MDKYICVYSSSSAAINQRYFDHAQELGEEMARRNFGLIFGGGMVGLMGRTAQAIHSQGGKVVGVIPDALNQPGIVYDTCDELIVTQTLRERKATMEERAQGFIALPGGFGTLEELLEIITLKQLRYHNKPIVILNTQGFFDGLIEIFENIINQKFAKVECRQLYFVTDSVVDAINHIENYKPNNCRPKWLTHTEEEC